MIDDKGSSRDHAQAIDRLVGASCAAFQKLDYHCIIVARVMKNPK